MNSDTPKNDQALERYLSPIHVWALSFGCAVKFCFCEYMEDENTE